MHPDIAEYILLSFSRMHAKKFPGQVPARGAAKNSFCGGSSQKCKILAADFKSFKSDFVSSQAGYLGDKKCRNVL